MVTSQKRSEKTLNGHLQYWMPDPLAERHYNVSPYAYCLNNPMIYIDPFGLDTVYVFDSSTTVPINNGTEAQTYTATIIVEQNGVISDSYQGSSFPNSSTRHRTVAEGEHAYNNQYGHGGGSRQGLNLVDENGNRKTPATTGDPPMTEINVHPGQPESANGTHNRGYGGCITVSPNDADAFMGHFDWSGTYRGYTGNTGTSTGVVILLRGDNATGLKNMVENRRDWQRNPLTPMRPLPARLR